MNGVTVRAPYGGVLERLIENTESTLCDGATAHERIRVTSGTCTQRFNSAGNALMLCA